MSEFNLQPQHENQPVVVAAYRTPVGRAHGCFSAIELADLVVPVIERLLGTANVEPSDVDEVILGNAIGGGGNMARLCALSAKLPVDVPGVTIDRQCGSGLEAINIACRLVQAGAGDCYLAGGAESVSTAPWRVRRPRSTKELPQFFARAQFSPDEIGDPDMGLAAENVAQECGISRERQDRFALRSHLRASRASADGTFAAEIVPIQTRGGTIDRDECPRPDASMEALSKLKPAFAREGTVTAGNACPLNDGAAAVLVMSRRRARNAGIRRGLVFRDSASAGVNPNLLGLGPVASTGKLLRRQPGLDLPGVGLIEFNEAFAAQVLGSVDQLGIPEESINRDGGALALGHPFGASGAILVARLFAQCARKKEDGLRSLAMLGIAGGLGITSLFQWSEDI